MYGSYQRRLRIMKYSRISSKFLSIQILARTISALFRFPISSVRFSSILGIVPSGPIIISITETFKIPHFSKLPSKVIVVFF